MVVLSVATLLSPLAAIASGSRYVIIIFLMEIISLFVLLRNQFSASQLKKVRKIICAILIVMCIPIMLVSFSRNNSNKFDTFWSVERYVAESFIHFNNYGLDAGGIRNGDRTATLFKQILGLNPAKNYAERLIKYSNMKMNESVFYTYVGDFTLDYGILPAVFIFLGLSFFFGKILSCKGNQLYFYQYIILYILLEICLGFYGYIYSDSTGGVRLLILLLIAMLFKIVPHFKAN